MKSDKLNVDMNICGVNALLSWNKPVSSIITYCENDKEKRLVILVFVFNI